VAGEADTLTVFALVTLLLFVGLPLVLAYWTASYWAALLPAASLVAAVLSYAVNQPAGTDEIDVLPGLWIAFSAIGVLVCLGGTALRRSRRASRL
jgi:hypothetical protein